MSPRRAGLGPISWLLLLVVGLGLGACAARSPKSAPGRAHKTMEPGSRDTDEASVAPEDLPALEAELDRAWGELQAFEDGTPEVATAAASPDGDPREPVDRCERIRGLADRICDLSDRMCELADEHPGEDRYAQGCERGRQTCAKASEAADRCAAG